MAKNLVIVESPAKARTISGYLGKNYEVRACMGHVRDLPKGSLGIDIEHGFKPRYVINKKKIARMLAEAAKRTDRTLLATDPDREGEAIAWHIVKVLKLPPDKALRVRFNEITREAVRASIRKPEALNEQLVDSQQARRLLDRIVGYKLSPLLWKKITKGLSAGRVQSVALKLIAEREAEIRAFTPEEYWKIAGEFRRKSGETFGAAYAGRALAVDALEGCPDCGSKLKSSKLKGVTYRKCTSRNCSFSAAVYGDVAVRKYSPGSKDEADAVLREVEGGKFTVVHAETWERKVKPPAPFITSRIQQVASTRLGFSPRRTMRIAQHLYEGIELGELGQRGLITYMRTDSRRVARSAIAAVRKVIGAEFGSDYLPEKPNRYSSRKGAQQAHEAIRPTDVTLAPEKVAKYLSPDQRKLYKLVWQCFVASQMKPARYAETSAFVAGAGHVFQAKGRELLFDGFSAVWKTDTETAVLPAIEQGEEVECVKLEPEQKFTQPSPRYSEASLIGTLEKNGVGRPSTYAVIVSTIQERGYVRREGRTLVPSELGLLVNQKLVAHFPDLIDVGFTARLEEELDAVEEGKTTSTAVLEEFYGKFAEALTKAEEEMESVRGESARSDHLCPLCGAPMVFRYSRTGKFLGCSRFPQCSGTLSLDEEGNPVEYPEMHCPNCDKIMLPRTGRRGLFMACSGYPECKTTASFPKVGKEEGGKPEGRSQGKPGDEKSDEELAEGQVCEKCGKPLVVKMGRRGKFLACPGYPECKFTRSLTGAKKDKPEDTGIACDKCGAPMVVRRGTRRSFLGCSAYPKCKNTKPLPKKLI